MFILAAYVQFLVGYAYCIMQISPTHRSISSSARERLTTDNEKDSIVTGLLTINKEDNQRNTNLRAYPIIGLGYIRYKEYFINPTKI